jgi:hypothetical protein
MHSTSSTGAGTAATLNCCSTFCRIIHGGTARSPFFVPSSWALHVGHYNAGDKWIDDMKARFRNGRLTENAKHVTGLDLG